MTMTSSNFSSFSVDNQLLAQKLPMYFCLLFRHVFPRILAALALLALLTSAHSSGCRSRSKAAAHDAATAGSPQSAAFLKKKLAENELRNVRRLAAKAKVTVDRGDGAPLTASANIIWVKDSALWLNVRKFGIEGARALLTTDSIYILNRLDKTFTVKSWAALQREYSLPGGFDLLENAVLARAWFADDMVLQADTAAGKQRISGSNGRLNADYWLENSVFRLVSMSFLQAADARSVTFGFGGYEKISGAGAFPYLRTIEASSPESGTGRIEIEFTDVEINTPKPLRFEVPEHYKRAD